MAREVVTVALRARAVAALGRTRRPWIYEEDVERGAQLTASAREAGPAESASSFSRSSAACARSTAAATSQSTAPGEVVRFVAPDGGAVAVGYFNTTAPRLWGRVLAWGADAPVPDAAWYAAAVERAVARRRPFYGDAGACRIVHAEADGLPGLTVDRLDGGILVAHSDVAGVHRAWPMLRTALLEAVPGARTVVLRASQRGVHEALPAPADGADQAATTAATGGRQRPPAVYGAPLPGEVLSSSNVTVPLVEHGVRYAVPVLAGQKTGWYFDQTANRALVARLRPRTILDVCCYLGGFGLTAARAHADTHATLVDSSAVALQLAQATATANGLADRVECIKGTASKVLADLSAARRRFDVVVLDPPPFARFTAALDAAGAGYFHLAKLACSLVADGGPSAGGSSHGGSHGGPMAGGSHGGSHAGPTMGGSHGGYLFFSTCSHAVTADQLTGIVAAAARATGRTARLVARPTAGPDHPVLLDLPETEYLRGVLVHLSN